ncbi:MAG: hypothetical protein GVY11_04955, partial [Gammaproteobacteria bacterium]|nr:hypothetical protein [Gammaproteobacteria bacterium]
YTLLQGEAGGVELGPNVIVVEDFPLIDPENDYSPLEGSTVIDAGRNEALPPGVTTDLLGNPRIVDATGIGEIVDLGAIEFGAEPMPDRISHKNFMAH